VVSWATREAVMGRGSCLVSPTTSQANRSVSAATTTRMPSATFSILVMTAPPSMLLRSGYRQTSLDASGRRIEPRVAYGVNTPPVMAKAPSPTSTRSTTRTITGT
jgi:hypothetical protein